MHKDVIFSSGWSVLNESSACSLLIVHPWRRPVGLLLFYVPLLSKYITLKHDRLFCACKGFLRRSGLQHERGDVADSDDWQAVSKQTMVEILAIESFLNWNPPTLCFNALESSTASTGAAPSWHRVWHCFCWHGDVPRWRKRPLACSRLKRAAGHRTSGTHPLPSYYT